MQEALNYMEYESFVVWDMHVTYFHVYIDSHKLDHCAVHMYLQVQF